LYCVGHEAFVTEKDLVNGLCPDHGTKPEFLKEENYFFKLSRYEAQIIEKIESDELQIVPQSRKNEILSFLREGLQDVSFSRPRKADWPEGLGVPVPGDDSQVMYVWCDALANYITALGYGQDETLYKEFWPADVHVIGKDILRFHAAIWPGMLLSAGVPLPKTLLVHGFITSGGKKMSKTLGNVIDPLELIKEYSGEVVRYYLARHISPFEDGDITLEAFKELYNGNLANGLGNVVSRVMTMAQAHLDAPVVPEEKTIPQNFLDAMDAFKVNEACDIVWEWVGKLDQRITLEKPFVLVKTDPEAAKNVIAELVRDVYTIGKMLHPILPKTSVAIRDAVKENKKPDNLFPRKE
jgi:methionyl-tRNA synthetase